MDELNNSQGNYPARVKHDERARGERLVPPPTKNRAQKWALLCDAQATPHNA
jgi:hypothetical protein